MEADMTSDLPEDAKLRWADLMELAEKKQPSSACTLRRQLPKFIEEVTQECYDRNKRPYLRPSFFWYFVHERAWLAMYKGDKEAGAKFRARYPWSLESQLAMQYGKPYCYQYLDHFFKIRAQDPTLQHSHEEEQKEAEERAMTGPLNTVRELKDALQDAASVSREEAKAPEVGSQDIGRELPVWECWPSSEERRRVAIRIFPARFPEKGLENFEFPAPAYKDWPACFGGYDWGVIQQCLITASADLGGCFGEGQEAIYPMRIALLLRDRGSDGSWVGVMRFGWYTKTVDPFQTHHLATIKLTYETLMSWHLSVLQGKPRDLASYTSAALNNVIRNANSVWINIAREKARLAREARARAAEEEQRDSLAIEAGVLSIDSGRARDICLQLDGFLRKAARVFISMKREKHETLDEAKRWLVSWVASGFEWGPFPFKDTCNTHLRREVAEEFCREVMVLSARKLWENFSTTEGDHPLRGVAVDEFFEWAEPSMDNDWALLLDAESRGNILFEAFNDLEDQAAIDYPDNEALRNQLRELHQRLKQCVEVAVQVDRGDYGS